jgi:predicted DNA-binding transcriptional regulator YafY
VTAVQQWKKEWKTRPVCYLLPMNRVDRLMAMVVQLQSRRVVRAEDMAAHFEISVRTVYRDFAALGEAGIPIVAEPGVGYGLVKGYHLPPVMFTADEASALSLGGKLVDHLTDASLSKQMSSALQKIRSVLPRERQDYLERLERSTVVVSRGSSADPRLKSEALIPIQRALAERRVLTIKYQGKERSELTHRRVEPLGLVYYADNWHLIAFCRLRRDVRDFRTDRISSFELASEIFPPHENFSLKKYLESCKENKFEMAYVRFDLDVMDRVRREPYCGTLEERPDHDGVVVTMLACSMDRLSSWILSFGEAAEVLAPKELRDRVAGEAKKVAAKYGNRQSSAILHHAGASL